MPLFVQQSGIGVKWASEIRDKYCPNCGAEFHDSPSYKQLKEQGRWCEKCQAYIIPALLVRQATIRPPVPPSCINPRCLIRYIKDVLTFAAIALYEQRRTVYAMQNRRKIILERYRTGEPMPETLWQAIHANIKLTCPVCRLYNLDPLLFRR